MNKSELVRRDLSRKRQFPPVIRRGEILEKEFFYSLKVSDSKYYHMVYLAVSFEFE